MQYLVSVIDDTPDSAISDEMTDINAFNDGLQADGHWVFAGGLGAPSTATVIDGRVLKRCSPMARSSRRRSGCPASGSSRPVTSTWRWS